MSVDAHSILAPSLPIGANRDHLVEELGEPQDVGKGLRGFTILAYRERTIQCTMIAGHLFLLALYFRPASDLLKWPECLAALADIYDTMKPTEVEDWLRQQQVQSRRSSVCGEEVIEAQIGVRFYFESGLLSSIQIISDGKCR